MEVVMPTKYRWSSEVEAVARAIAGTDGWKLDDDVYSPIAVPVGRAWHYWCCAVAAIGAYESALSLQRVSQNDVAVGELE
jgi:hypothetical protein